MQSSSLSIILHPEAGHSECSALLPVGISLRILTFRLGSNPVPDLLVGHRSADGLGVAIQSGVPTMTRPVKLSS